ncbi:MAG: SGNH/GDSL hydrolase family protein [Paracoccaceae bacterium]
MRILVYGDSNSWGAPPDGSAIRFDTKTRWPCVMAHVLGATLIEDALPGRTTVHDDVEFYGAALNGLAHLPTALLAQSPLNWVLIMLGTNDFKARFHPSAAVIAQNLGRLIDCIHDVGGGVGPWNNGHIPKIAVIVPPPLTSAADSPDFEDSDEWRGGRVASVGLADAVRVVAQHKGIAVFDAGTVVAGSANDPIHLDADSHIVLGRAVAAWLHKLNEDTDTEISPRG